MKGVSTLYYLLISITVGISQAIEFSEIGLGAQLTTDILTSRKWMPIQGWTATKIPGLFAYGINLGEAFEIPLSGIYFISSNIHFTIRNSSSNNQNLPWTFSSCFLNQRTITFTSCGILSGTLTSLGIQTLSVSNFVYLHHNDRLQILVKSTRECYTNAGSSVSLQYMGTMISSPGFSLLLRNDTHIERGEASTNPLLNYWDAVSGQGTFTRQSGLEIKDGMTTVHCKGIYAVSLMVLIEGEPGEYQASLIYGKENVIASSKQSLHMKGKTSLSLSGLYHFKHGDTLRPSVLSILGSSFRILANSWISTVFVGKYQKDNNEFSISLNATEFRSSSQWQSLNHFFPSSVPCPQFLENQRISVFAGDKLTLGRSGIYFVFLQVLLEVEKGDQVQFLFSLGRSPRFATLTSGLSASVSNGGSQAMNLTLTVTGMLTIQSNQYFSFFFRSHTSAKFRILKPTWVSLARLRVVGLVGGATFSHIPRTLEGPSSTGDDSLPAPLKPWSLMPSDNFGFNKGMNATHGIFTAPFKGIYMLALNMMFSCDAIQGELIYLGLIINEPEKNATFHNEAIPRLSREQRIISLSIPIILAEGTRLSIGVKVNGTVFISRESSFYISLMDLPESTDTMLAEAKSLSEQQLGSNSDVFLSWNQVLLNSRVTQHSFANLTGFIIPSDGIYIITCNVLASVTRKSMDGVSKLQLGVGPQGLPEVERLQDQIRIASHLLSQNVSFSVSGVMDLKQGQNLTVIISTEDYLENLEVFDGRLMLKFSSRSEAIQEQPEALSMLKVTQKMFDFQAGEWYAVHDVDFPSNEASFKTSTVAMNGPHLLATKAMFVLVSTTVEVQRGDGEFNLRFRIVPRNSEIHYGIACTVIAKSADSVLLKLSGIIYLEHGERLELVIRATRTSQLVLSSRSYLALIAQRLPARKYQLSNRSNPSDPELLTFASNKRKLQAMEGGLYVILQCCFPNFKEDATIDLALRPKFLKLQYLKAGEELNSQNFSAPSIAILLHQSANNFAGFYVREQRSLPCDTSGTKCLYREDFESLRQKVSGVTTAGSCNVFLIAINIYIMSKGRSVALIIADMNTERVVARTMKVNSLHNIVFYASVCLFDFPSVLLVLDADRDNEPWYLLQGSQLFVTLVEHKEYTEGFAAFYIPRSGIETTSTNLTRLENYLANVSMSYDNTKAYRSGSGGLFLNRPGKYLITISIMLQIKNKLKRDLRLRVVKDKAAISEMDILVNHASIRENNVVFSTSRAAIVTVKTENFIEIVASSEAIDMIKASSLSLLFLEPVVTLETCPVTHFDVQSTTNHEVVLKEHVNFTTLCYVTPQNVADLYWLKNGEVVAFAPGAQNLTLELTDTSIDSSGIYQCIGKKGDVEMQADRFRIAVYDPIPEIFPSNGTFEMYENGRINDLVFTFDVIAAKQSYSEKAEVYLSIVSGDPSHNFYIVPNRTRSRASLLVYKLLDYETQSVFNLTIRARNLEFNGTAERQFFYTVFVQDLNDNKPKFDRLLHSVSILESEEPETRIYSMKAYDKDSGTHSCLTYSLLENGDSAFFWIHNRSGDIYLREKLDRETHTKHIILVIASDNYFRSFAELVVHVLDVNDNAPRFVREHASMVVTEATLPGTVLVQVHAQDPDLGTSGEVDYYLEQDDLKDDFQVDRQGNLRTSRSIEKFAGHYLVLTIKAFDGGGLISENRFVAFLNISPISYFKTPRFDKSVYTVLVPENTPRGALLVQLKASFKVQAGDFKFQVIYKLPSQASDLVNLQQEMGKVYLGSELDYERGKVHKVAVKACDKYAESRCSDAVVEILVQDVNDNPPLFTVERVNISISEATAPGTIIYKVEARDVDGEKNNRISYKVINNNPRNSFLVDEVSGAVILAKELDYEWSQQFLLVILAHDSGVPVLSSTMTLNISVVDENEHAPLFNTSEYRVSIKENNEVGRILVTVLATDLDRTDKVSYRIDCGQDARCSRCIHISEKTGVIKTICSFDREQQNSYQATIEASDSRKYPLKSAAYFSLSILDENDNAPRFQYYNMKVNVSLSTLPNSYVYCIHGVDEDSGVNSKIVYSFVPESDLFDILPGGVVYLKKDIDPIHRDSTLILQVAARDEGEPSLTSLQYANLSISILGSYYSNFPGYEYLPIEVMENATVGEMIGHVQRGSPCCETTYVMQGSLAFNFFKVDPKTGVIKTKKRLDYEYLNAFTFTVFGYSNSKIVYKGLLQITVLNVDERRIIFKKTKTIITISESAPVGTIVKKMDLYYEGYNAAPQIRYKLSLLAADASILAFEVNNDGLIQVIQPLDFEVQHKYYLQLVALDSEVPSISTTTHLVVIIVDENDNNPVFDSPTAEITIRESKPIDQVVLNSRAVDADSGENGRITYSIISCIPKADFRVDSESGNVIVQNELDFETTKRYEIYVRAKDNGSASRYSVRRIIIIIRDENDNHPEFLYTAVNTYIKADSPLGAKIGKVRAEDKDSEENGRVGYLLSSVKQNFTPFSLDFLSGEIIQQDILSNITNYTLTISATDHGSPPLKSKQQLVYSIHVFKEHPTASLPCSIDNLSSTHIELRLNLLDYFGIKAYGIYKIGFIVQEYHPDDPECAAYTELPFLTWYTVYYKRDINKNYLRRYLTGYKYLTNNRHRITRNIRYLEMIEVRYKVGVERDCTKKEKRKAVCNGPLLPGNTYRFQLEVFFGENNESVTTSFTPSYRTEAVTRILPQKGLSETFYYTFGLLAFCLSMIIVLAAVLCYIYWRRKHTYKSRREAGVQKDDRDESEPDELEFLKRCNGTELQEIAVYFGSSSSSSLFDGASTFMSQKLLPKQKIMVQTNC